MSLAEQITGRRLAFIPCGFDGVLDVLSLDAPGGVKRIASIKTEVGARTGAPGCKDGHDISADRQVRTPATTGGRPVAVRCTFRLVIVKPM